MTPVDETDMSPLFMKVVFERQERSSAPDMAYIHDKFSGNGSEGGGGEDRDGGTIVSCIKVNASRITK